MNPMTNSLVKKIEGNKPSIFLLTVEISRIFPEKYMIFQRGYKISHQN